VTIFLVELILRIYSKGWREYFFSHSNFAWALLDTVTVSLGVFDTWLTPAMKSLGVELGSKKNKSLRALRLLRLLRMVRVIRVFPQLQVFMHALVVMFGQMIWIFLVLAIILVSCSIVVTTYLGGDADGSFADVLAADNFQTLKTSEAVRLSQISFRDVPTSVFTLFIVITQDNWRKIADPLIVQYPFARVLFVPFIFFASWIMISVLTAVASDSMVSATSDKKEDEVKKQMARAAAFITFLEESFRAADADGSGTLDKNEFEKMVGQEVVHQEMSRLGFSMSEEELIKVWDILDVEGSGELHIQDFVAGLSYMQEKLSTRHVVGLGYALQRVAGKMHNKMEEIKVELETLRCSQEKMLEALYRQDVLAEEQELHLQLWQEWMAANDPETLRRLKAEVSTS
jgi:voltage-gated sodium channel